MKLARLLQKGSLRGSATAIPAIFATVDIDTGPRVARVATVAVANAQKVAANDPAPIPDAVVIVTPDLFAQRVQTMQGKGINAADAETYADKLVQRDRDLDDRRLCLECLHLHGYGPTSWRCGAWQAAGIATQARDAGLSADLVQQLQRCDGFADSIQPRTPA